MKIKILTFSLLFLLILSKGIPLDLTASATIQNPNLETTSSALQNYINSYNQALRDSANIYIINTNVKDEIYIRSAKNIINSELKNPSSATYNNAYVHEKDDYGRAIVFLDVSAQNSLGGYNRNHYYVCIQSINNDNSFTYNSLSSWILVSNPYAYNIFRSMNDFSLSPAEISIHEMIADVNLVYIHHSIFFQNWQEVFCYSFSTANSTHYVYTNSTNDRIISAQAVFTPSSKAVVGRQDKESIMTKTCEAVINAMSKVNGNSSDTILDSIINLHEFSPSYNPAMYLDGFVYDCALMYDELSFAVTTLDKTTYDAGHYWTPNAHLVYFEQLADSYLKKSDYELAILFYEQSGIETDKLYAAHYGKGEELNLEGEFLYAVDHFDSAGDYSDAQVRILEMYYKTAVIYEKDHDYISAISHYSNAASYSDSSERRKACYYEQGNIYLINQQYKEAITCYGDAFDYIGASEKYKEANYLYARQLLTLDQPEESKIYLNNAAGYLDADKRIQQYLYDKGTNALNTKDYLFAAEMFNSADGFLDSAEKIIQCNYEYGISQMKMGYTTPGLEYLEKCRGYKDTDNIIFAHYYEKAKQALEIYISSFLDPRYDNDLQKKYLSVAHMLHKCEGYLDSYNLNTTLETIESMRINTLRANKMLIEPKLSYYEVSHDSTNIYFTSVGPSSVIPGTDTAISIISAIDVSTYSAYITNMFVGDIHYKESIEAIRLVVALFSGNFNDVDFEAYINNEGNWRTSGDHEILTFNYGGYHITVDAKIKFDSYSLQDCAITGMRIF